MKELNIILNGKPVKGNSVETILEVALKNGIEIPTLCNDPRISPYSSCYVCVVEVDGIKTLQPACSTRINEGMQIETENERVKKARKIALELLLSDHYADCVAPCKLTCPAGVDVQGYISLIEKGLYYEAVALVKEVNPLPAICGRVCVRPCEVACRRNFLDEGAPVGIDYLKRFAADADLESENKFVPEVASSTGKRVAIIGAGPGGLSAAYFLQTKGHQCDIYEAAPAAGGWLRYGIPEYRLPNDILQKEVDNITELGVNIHYDQKLGDNLKYKTLKDAYDAVILTIGSQKGTGVGCEGDDADGVYPGIIFLKNMEMTGQKYDFKGKTVAVVGGGNTAMDCCRTSIRCGADRVIVVYRRTEKEMPANPIEIHESKVEGAEYMLLTNPVKVNKNEQGKVVSMTLIKMELGEPDASGRRRPIPVEGSEFDVDVDIILAAIGQKTDVNFIDDINENTSEGELKINRWGDIDADEKTLQTGIPGVFAAGDGVTGPATLIEAIAQAKIASRSCHQYLNGDQPTPEHFEFISKKDIFKEQTQEDYYGKFAFQKREEMPVLEPDKRANFDEVEIGYHNEDVAKNETSRCMECGCVEYYDCDLKNYATTYKAEQTKYEGEYKRYEIDFSHPYIEIDNNKCILCSRCIRVCKEVVGASALGLINRGFNTYVAPSMGKSLLETTCESCGMCISACPTAAITENVPFKPGPVKLEEITSIDPYGSEGFKIKLMHKGGFVMRTKGLSSAINPEANISTKAKFGYKYLNDKNRIISPLIKRNGKFVPIGYNEAISMIAEKIKAIIPGKTALFAGGRLTNEEQYMVQKLARGAIRTNNIHSFLYLNRSEGYEYITDNNVPFMNIKDAKKIYIVGSKFNYKNPLVNHLIFTAKYKYGASVELITDNNNCDLAKKVDKVLKVEDYLSFFRALNNYLLSNNKQNQFYIDSHCTGFEQYEERLLKENYSELIKKSGCCCSECVEEVGSSYNSIHESIIVYSTEEVSASVAVEIRNLSLITGKPGKSNSGVVALREKNNAQGLFDMGVNPSILVGNVPIKNKIHAKRVADKWKCAELPVDSQSLLEMLQTGSLQNVLIFGEDPVGCAVDKNFVKDWFKNINFKVVVDYFITETATEADVILPATLPVEMNGSFTNTQRYLQTFDEQTELLPEMNVLEMLAKLIKEFGYDSTADPVEILNEAHSLLPKDKTKACFTDINNVNKQKLFNHGCDIVNKLIDDEMSEKLSVK